MGTRDMEYQTGKRPGRRKAQSTKVAKAKQSRSNSNRTDGNHKGWAEKPFDVYKKLNK